MNRAHLVRLGGPSLVLAALLVGPLLFSAHTTQLMAESLVLAVSAMGFVFLHGYAGLTSMAQMAYFAVSGYFIAVMTMTFSHNFWFAAACGVVGAVVVAAVFALIAYRTSGIYFLMMSLALSQLAYSAFLQWASVTGGFRGFSGIARPTLGPFDLSNTIPRYFFFLIVAIGVYLLLKVVGRSPYGLALRAGRDNPVKIEPLGVDFRLQRFSAHLVAGGIAGVAGVLGVIQYGVVSPATTGLTEILKVIMAAIIGGALWLEGGILGAFIVIYLISFVSAETQRYWLIIGTLFVLVIILLPQGIIGGLKRLEKRFGWISRFTRMVDRGYSEVSEEGARVGIIAASDVDSNSSKKG